MPLQFGINLWPHQWQAVSRIEELGYDSAWTSEHIFFYFPTFDALTSLAAMAARTSRIRLGTAVLLLPLRPAALAAKEIASVDIISGGRLIVGVGVGGEYPKEFEAVGVPVEERGARTDEALEGLTRRYNQPFEKIADRYVAMGNADDCARRLADFAEAGVEHFILVPIVRSFADFMPQVEAYARDVVPKVRTS